MGHTAAATAEQEVFTVSGSTAHTALATEGAEPEMGICGCSALHVAAIEVIGLATGSTHNKRGGERGKSGRGGNDLRRGSGREGQGGWASSTLGWGGGGWGGWMA